MWVGCGFEEEWSSITLGAKLTLHEGCNGGVRGS